MLTDAWDNKNATHKHVSNGRSHSKRTSTRQSSKIRLKLWFVITILLQ